MRKLLPIGSIIKVKDHKDKYMIIGKVIRKNEKETYDYMCVKYPYGFVESEEEYFFADEDVESCIFLGDINY